MSGAGWGRGYGAGGGYGRGWGLGAAGPIPPMVRGLLIANVGVYVLQLLGGKYFLIESFALVPALVARLELWRLFTWQFLHGGIIHLLFNMLMLWMFGSELEQRWGQRFFFKYYMVCAVGAALTFTVAMFIAGTPRVVSFGASGAVYGVMMAYGMWFPTRTILVALVFPMQARYFVFLLIGIAFIMSVENSPGGGVAHAAHFGGAAVGYLYLRWWGAGGLGVASIPSWRDLRRNYYRWRLRRLQKKRLGGGGGITYH